VARRYQDRIELLKTVGTMMELHAIISLHLHPLKGDRAGTWAINLTEQWRLIFSIQEDYIMVEEVSNHYE
jgi:plasmid maintenance system killer protein